LLAGGLGASGVALYHQRRVQLVGASAASGRPLRRMLVLPGSFNPLHEGHLGLARVAMALRPGLPLAYEISLSNIDKGEQPGAFWREGRVG